MEAVKIESLSKNFGGLEVLKDCSLTVEDRQYVAIIGPNGAGKTTLLNVVNGELPATSGHVHIFGQEITGMPTYRRARLGLARSFQITRLFHDLTVLDNLSLALQGAGSFRYQIYRPATAYDETSAEAQKLLEMVNLWEKRSELIQTISYGEQRKMEIVISLASKPKVLLMDEPTAGLAVDEIPDFINMIKTLARGSTLMFAAHDMSVVFGLADRVVVLYFGRIVADGTPEEIQSNSMVKEIYLGLTEDSADAGAS